MFVLQVTVQQMPAYVLATVMSVLAQAQHIAVQQVMLFVQILLAHVTVQAVAQCLIVSHALMIHMVCAVIQRVVVILAAPRTIMV